MVFVGHSIAGVVAAELAATRSDRLLGALMLGPVLPSENVKETFEQRVKTVEKEGMEAMANTIPTAATGTKSTPLQHAMIRSLLLSQKVEGYSSMCRVVGGASSPDYAAVGIPTLLVAGEEDKRAPLKGCEEILRRLGGEKNMEIEKGVGHWFCIEDPDTTASLIARFVDGLINGKRDNRTRDPYRKSF